MTDKPKVGKMIKEEGYDVTVRGQYYAFDGKNKTIKSWGPINFFVPRLVKIIEKHKRVQKKIGNKLIRKYIPIETTYEATAGNVIQHYIQRRLLPTYLQENYPDSVRFRTCAILSKKPCVKETNYKELSEINIAEASIEELRRVVTELRLSVPLGAYPILEDARLAVQEALDDENARRAEQGDPLAEVGGKLGDPAELEEIPDGEGDGEEATRGENATDDASALADELEGV